MADTWGSNTFNQGVTFKAFLDGVSTGGFQGGYTSTPPNTRELMTVGDLSTYGVWIYGANMAQNSIYSTFSGISNSKVLTKYNLIATRLLDTVATTQCSATSNQQFLYANYINTTSEPWDIGIQLYTNRACTTAKTFSGTVWIFYYNNGESWQVNSSGVVLQIVGC